MSDKPITVKKLRYWQPINLLGKDEQGRQLYQCPTPGCGETAYFGEDGKGHCPMGDAEEAYLRQAYESLLEHLPEANLGFDPTIFKHAADKIDRGSRMGAAGPEQAGATRTETEKPAGQAASRASDQHL